MISCITGGLLHGNCCTGSHRNDTDSERFTLLKQFSIGVAWTSGSVMKTKQYLPVAGAQK